MERIIKEELVNKLLNYLAEKPWREAHDLMQALFQLPKPKAPGAGEKNAPAPKLVKKEGEKA